MVQAGAYAPLSEARFAICSPVNNERIVVTTAPRESDARLVVYGLRLRGLRAESRPGPIRSRALEIVVPADQADAARRVINDVWDAVFEHETAVRPDGTCPFCGYSVIGLPRSPSGRLRCPECGVDLRSAEARLAARDGKTLRRPTDT